MTSVHQAASVGFESGALKYQNGRPDYPLAVTDWLKRSIKLSPEKTVIDLGSGTGKFIPQLKETGARIIAVEPVSAMRAQLIRAHPDIEALDGSATSIPLPKECVDAIVCAQSFHWFATAEALQEIRRVLKPGGYLCLVWNGRDVEVNWVARMAELLSEYEADTPRYHKQDWRKVFPAPGFSTLDELYFDYTHHGHPDSVIIDRLMSISFISALPIDEQMLFKQK